MRPGCELDLISCVFPAGVEIKANSVGVRAERPRKGSGMSIVVNYRLVNDGVIEALEALLACAERGVDLRAKVRDFLDDFPTVAIGEIERCVATAAGETIARLKCSQELEVLLAALRAQKGDGNALDHAGGRRGHVSS